MSIKADILKALDAIVGRAACLLPQRRSATGDRPVDPPPRRVLVIRPGGIGDAVLFIPMLQQLRRAWPEAELDLLMERRNAGVLAGTGLADHLFRYDRFPGDLLRVLRRRYDVVIDTEQFHHLSAFVARLTGAPRAFGFGTNCRRRLLTDVLAYNHEVYEVLSFLDLARRATGLQPVWDPDASFYPVSPKALAFADAQLAGLRTSRKVAIHPGASIPERRWAAENYAKLALMLAEQGVGIVVLGGPGDGRAAGVIHRAVAAFGGVNLAGRCSLPQAAAVVSRVDAYVSADSGVLHLAYGVGTPTVHLFGPGVLAKWGPPGQRFLTVKTSLPCSPCTHYGYTPPCNQGMLCMKGITPEMVFGTVQAQLRSGAAHHLESPERDLQ